MLKEVKKLVGSSSGSARWAGKNGGQFAERRSSSSSFTILIAQACERIILTSALSGPTARELSPSEANVIFTPLPELFDEEAVALVAGRGCIAAIKPRCRLF